MTRRRGLEPVNALTDQAAGADQVADRPLQHPTIPNVCFIADVCAHLRLSERQFHYLMARKQLALVELVRIDRRRRFTGESVKRQIQLWAGKSSLRRVG